MRFGCLINVCLCVSVCAKRIYCCYCFCSCSWSCCCCCRIFFCADKIFVCILICKHMGLKWMGFWLLLITLATIDLSSYTKDMFLLFLCVASSDLFLGRCFLFRGRERGRRRKEVIESNQPNDNSWYIVVAVLLSVSHFTQIFMSANKLHVYWCVSGVISKTKRVIRRDKLIIRWFNQCLYVFVFINVISS